MTTVLSSEREKLELENLPEYTREEDEPKKDVSNAMPAKTQEKRERVQAQEVTPPTAASNDNEDVLEALWPGVHHDFTQPVRRGPSFYLTIGFMGGAVVSLMAVWAFSAATSLITSSPAPEQKQIVMARGANVKAPAPEQAGQQPPAGGEVIVPLAATYEVAEGDTLAAIAIKNYKHVSPRLIDEICKANGMRNANVLSLGQKLVLPEYRKNTSQVAASSSTQVQ
ncbi:MAG TPA: LysM domain-containing protein [Candidatus Obscuribacterales bacterium]